MASFITKGDYSLMRLANNWVAPRWVRHFVVGSTRGGDGWLWCAIGVAIFFLGGEEKLAALSGAGLAALASVLLFVVMKRYTGRARPCHIEPHCWAKLLPPDQFSFPSGHSMTAFAIAVPLSLTYPTFAVALLFFAISIAASRIVLGMHFLSDVIAGALIGAGMGYISYFAFQS